MKTELSHRGYTGSVDVSIEDGCLHGRILFIDDIISYEGNTVEELRSSFEAAVADYLAYCEAAGQPANKPYSGSFNVRIGPDRHKAAAHYAARSKISLNEAMCRAVDLLVAKVEAPQVVNNHYHQHVHVEDPWMGVQQSVPLVNEEQQWRQ